MKEQKKDSSGLSAYEKAAEEGIDPRCIPQRLEGPVPEHDEITYPDLSEICDNLIIALKN